MTFLDGTDEICHQIVVVLIPKVDERARLHDVTGSAGIDDDRVLEHRFELADAGLVVTLLVLCRVVIGVLRDVTVLAGSLDPQRELAPARRRPFFQFCLEPRVTDSSDKGVEVLTRLLLRIV